MLARKTLSSRTDKVNVRRLLENEARCANRVAQSLHTRDAPGTQGRSVHQQRIHLHAAVTRQKGAATGVKGVVVLHCHHGLFDRLDG